MNSSLTWTVLVGLDTTDYYKVDIDHSRVAPGNIVPADLGSALRQLALEDVGTAAACHLGTSREAPCVINWAQAGAVPIVESLAHIAARVTASEMPTVTGDAATAISDTVAQLTVALDTFRVEINRDMHGQPVNEAAATGARVAYQAAGSSLVDALTAACSPQAPAVEPEPGVEGPLHPQQEADRLLADMFDCQAEARRRRDYLNELEDHGGHDDDVNTARWAAEDYERNEEASAVLALLWHIRDSGVLPTAWPLPPTRA